MGRAVTVAIVPTLQGLQFNQLMRRVHTKAVTCIALVNNDIWNIWFVQTEKRKASRSILHTVWFAEGVLCWDSLFPISCWIVEALRFEWRDSKNKYIKHFISSSENRTRSLSCLQSTTCVPAPQLGSWSMVVKAKLLCN